MRLSMKPLSDPWIVTTETSFLKKRPSNPLTQTSSAWKTFDTKEAPLSSSKQKYAPPAMHPVDDIPIPDVEHISATEMAKSYKDSKENKLLQKTRDIDSFIKWNCRQIGKSKLSKTNLEGPAFKLVRPFHKNEISLQFQMEECHMLLTDKIDLTNPEGNRVVPNVSKPLPLGGPPGQVPIQTQYFFNKDLEYLVSGEKERRSALLISKLKAANYQDFGSKNYAPSDRRAVRFHMKILSAVSLKTLSRYGYTYLKEIVLCRADYQDYKISEADLKNLHPNDFKDLYLLHLQGKLNHLS
nr:hypothetical protein [Tanacetum cinerariifolium]